MPAYASQGKYDRFVLETTDDNNDKLLLFFDGIEREQHGIPVSIPDHPLDTGRFVQDHALIRPEIIDVDLIITESPLGTHRTPSFLEELESDVDYAPRSVAGSARTEQVMDMLRRMRGRLLTISSPRYGVLTSFQLTSIVSRVNGPRRRMSFAITLKYVQFAEAASVIVPLVDRGKKMEEPGGLLDLVMEKLGVDELGSKSILQSLADNEGSLQEVSKKVRDLPGEVLGSYLKSVSGSN